MQHQKPHETYHSHRPRLGDMVTDRDGNPIGPLRAVEAGYCWAGPAEGPFLWCFRDGLNALHFWPAKAGGKIAACPGLR